MDSPTTDLLVKKFSQVSICEHGMTVNTTACVNLLECIPEVAKGLFDEGLKIRYS